MYDPRTMILSYAKDIVCKQMEVEKVTNPMGLVREYYGNMLNIINPPKRVPIADRIIKPEKK